MGAFKYTAKADNAMSAVRGLILFVVVISNVCSKWIFTKHNTKNNHYRSASQCN